MGQIEVLKGTLETIAIEIGNAFLPAIYQGTPIGKAGGPISDATIRDLSGPISAATKQAA